MEKTLNIIVAGKSGVGKSSFLNYLCDEDVFETGDGNPVTQEYFQNRKVKGENKITFNLYDTKGIEPTTTKEALNKITEKIEKHDSSTDMYQWIHSVYYCFAASSKRIEPFEIDFINQIQKETSVVILLTKCDLISADETESLRQQLYSQLGTNIQVFPICSVEKITRKGASKQFGKENILKHSCLGLWNKLATFLPELINDYIFKINILIDWRYNTTKTQQKWNNYYKENNIPNTLNHIYLEQAFDLPSLSDLGLNDLFESDRKYLINLLESTKPLFQLLPNKIKSSFLQFKQITYQYTNEAISFYEELNGSKLKFITTKKSEETKKESIDLCSLIKDEVLNKLNKLIREIRKSDNSSTALEWVFNLDNKYNTRREYEDFRMFSWCQFDRLGGLIKIYISSYQTELHQYGQYCIRDLDNENISNQTMYSQKVINAVTDLTINEKTYFSTLSEVIGNTPLSKDHRHVLDTLRQVLNIAPERAGLIEDLSRRN